MALGRRDIRGGAVQTTITGGITNASTSCAIAASTGWPDGASFAAFYVVIDPGLSTEEKVLCSTRSSLTVNFTTRGADGTSASAHASGAAIYPIISAVDADEANNAVSQTIGAVTTKGDLLPASAANTLTRLAVGSNGLPLVANSAQTTGLGYAALAAAGLASDSVTTVKILDANVTTAKLAAGAVTANELGTGAVTSAKILDGTIVTGDIAAATILDSNLAAVAWTAYSPTVTQGVTVTKSNDLVRYRQIGKSVEYQGLISLTSGGTAGSALTITLPVTAFSGASQHVGTGWVSDFTNATLFGVYVPSTTTLGFYASLTSGAPVNAGTVASQQVLTSGKISWSIIYEAA